MSLWSPRDPRSTETLQSFLKAVDWAKAGRFTEQDIDEAKLSVFSVVDAPVAPSDRGMWHKRHSSPPVLVIGCLSQLPARRIDVPLGPELLGVGHSQRGASCPLRA